MGRLSKFTQGFREALAECEELQADTLEPNVTLISPTVAKRLDDSREDPSEPDKPRQSLIESGSGLFHGGLEGFIGDGSRREEAHSKKSRTGQRPRSGTRRGSHGRLVLDAGSRTMEVREELGESFPHCIL